MGFVVTAEFQIYIYLTLENLTLPNHMCKLVPISNYYSED